MHTLARAQKKSRRRLRVAQTYDNMIITEEQHFVRCGSPKCGERDAVSALLCATEHTRARNLSTDGEMAVFGPYRHVRDVSSRVGARCALCSSCRVRL